MDSTWTELHNQAYQIYSQPNVISVRADTERRILIPSNPAHALNHIPGFFLSQFCEFVSVSWLANLVGKVVRMLLDYVSHVSICPDLKRILEREPEWDEISDMLSNFQLIANILDVK